MNLDKFLTYCKLKGYVEDDYTRELLGFGQIRTIHLYNNRAGASISQQLNPDTATNKLGFAYHITDYFNDAVWSCNSLDDVIETIAPEL